MLGCSGHFTYFADSDCQLCASCRVMQSRIGLDWTRLDKRDRVQARTTTLHCRRDL